MSICICIYNIQIDYVYIYIWIVLVCRMDFHRICLICDGRHGSAGPSSPAAAWTPPPRLSQESPWSGSCSMEKSWKITENHGKSMEQSWKIMGHLGKSMEKSWKITGNHGKSLENHRDFFKKNHWKITGTSMEKSIKINGQSMDNQ